jgi:hypothetical protein
MQSLDGVHEAQERPHHRRPGADEDRPEHQGGAPGQPEQPGRRQRCQDGRDDDPETDQTQHHTTGRPDELGQVQAQPRVVEDDRYGQGHQRLERGTEQLVGMDGVGHRARGEADRQQQDQRRHMQPAGSHLAADGEHERQADPDQDLIGGHRGPSPVRRRPRDSSSHPRPTVLITASHRPDV